MAVVSENGEDCIKNKVLLQIQDRTKAHTVIVVATVGLETEAECNAAIAGFKIPGTAAKNAIRQVADSGACRIDVRGRSGGIVSQVVPVMTPFPHISSHVVQAVAVGIVGIVAHGRCVGVRRQVERIGIVIIRLVAIGFVVAPGILEIVTSAARRILPFGFSGKTVSLFRNVQLPGRKVVTFLTAFLFTAPVTVCYRAVPGYFHQGMTFFTGSGSEDVPIPGYSAVGRA